MSLYQASGDTASFSNDGTPQTGNIAFENSFNQITGSAGPVEVKIINTSAANVATVSWVKEDIVYSYANVSPTSTSGSGANATFNINSTYSGYTATINNPGTDYGPTDTCTIDGSQVGGSDGVNDVTITVVSANIIGAITSITTSGTQAWPQGTLQNTVIAPNTTEFVQINSVAGSTQFTVTCGDGNVFITPVNVL